MRCIALALVACVSTLSAATGDYSCWMGPDGGRAVDSGVDLVDSLADAKLVWESEQKLPTIYTDPQNVTRFPITHYCLPSVADGLVYYVYPMPDQTAPLDEVSVMKFTKSRKWKEADRVKLEFAARQGGDDVILCVDADTGKTVWKKTMQGKGQNLIYNGNYYAAPIVADGKVYVMGSYLWVYCLDARSGELLWETEMKEARAGWLKHFNDWLAGDYAKTLAGFKDGSITHYKEHYVLSGLNVCSPVLAGGVLVCNDSGGHSRHNRGGTNSLIGLDPTTGKRLWRLEHGVQNAAAPQRWVHEGRELVITQAGGGFRCVDPKAGKALWTHKATTAKWGNFCISGDYLVTGWGKKKTHGNTCYRIKPDGMEQLWQLPVGKTASYTTPAIYKGHAFCRGGDKQKNVTLFAVELETGKIVKETFWAGGNTCNSPMIADDRLWFSWEDYINVDPESPDFMKQLAGDDPKSRNPKLKRNGWASASVAQGRVFYRNGTRLMCADFRKK